MTQEQLMALLVLVVGAGIGALLNSMRLMRRDVGEVPKVLAHFDTRITAIETWRPLHEVMDMDHHRQTIEVAKKAAENVHDVRNKMNDLALHVARCKAQGRMDQG